MIVIIDLIYVQDVEDTALSHEQFCEENGGERVQGNDAGTAGSAEHHQLNIFDRARGKTEAKGNSWIFNW